MDSSLERLLFRADKYTFDLQGVFYFVALIVVLVCAIQIMRREHGGPPRELIFLHLFSVGFWLLSRGMARFAVDPDYVVFWYRSAYFYIPAGIVLMYQYINHTIGMSQQRRRWIQGAWAGAVLLTVLPITDPALIVAGLASFPWGVEPVHGPVGTLLLLFTAVITTRCLLDLHNRRGATSADTDEGGRVRRMLLATLVLTFAATDFLVAEGLPLYPLGVVAVPAFFLVVNHLARRYGLVDITAAVAAERIMSVAGTPILVVDRDNRIRVANEAALNMLVENRGVLIGESLKNLFGNCPDLYDLSTWQAENEGADYVLARRVGAEENSYAIKVAQVTNLLGEVQVFVCTLRDLTAERRQEQERIEASLRDPLTGLPGRATFLESVARAMQNVERGYTPCGLLFIGVDRFRSINEELSYEAGDKVLCELVARIKKDMGMRDIVARVGGDEFAVLLESGYRREVVLEDAKKILGLVEEPIQIDDRPIHLSLSIGAALMQRGQSDPVGLLRNAARAQHWAKTEGRNSIRFYEPDAHSESEELMLEAQLRNGLAEQRFVPHYQPVFDLEARRIVGFEALARWDHAERGIVSAYHFIEFAEEIGLIGEISDVLQRQVFADLARLSDAVGDAMPYVSINVSDVEFARADFVDRLQQQVVEAGLTPAAICLEITERMVMLDPGDQRLESLSDAGYRLFIDDFGTGYSSMTRLHSLPLDTLKIDRQFVLAMGRDENGVRLVEGIINLARSLKLNIIAEGVGEEKEAEMLRSLNCPCVQGYYFGKPMPFEEAFALYLSQQRGSTEARVMDRSG